MHLLSQILQSAVVSQQAHAIPQRKHWHRLHLQMVQQTIQRLSTTHPSCHTRTRQLKRRQCKGRVYHLPWRIHQRTSATVPFAGTRRKRRTTSNKPMSINTFNCSTNCNSFENSDWKCNFPNTFRERRKSIRTKKSHTKRWWLGG